MSLDKHLKFEQEVSTTIWNEKESKWIVKTKKGDTFEGNFFISAAGALVVPKYPKYKGMDLFKGKTIHTRKWDPKMNYEGKKVAVIGTGASAVQLVPAIVDKVKHLTLYQRSPAWVTPR
jgi:cation diffusion facilitator CzcD-associated flavoprotein CzcO